MPLLTPGDSPVSNREPWRVLGGDVMWSDLCLRKRVLAVMWGQGGGGLAGGQEASGETS